MLAIGPIFAEQESFEAHRPFRDKMATIEKAVADILSERGYFVLGIHHSGSEIEASLLEEITTIIDEKFPDKANSK
jgi:hypothetical protein